MKDAPAKYCKDCKSYDPLTKKCQKKDFYVARKNTCEEHE
jgi:hypothetical protein